MADPATFGDSRRAAALGAELRFTSKAIKADDVLTGLEKELAEALILAKETDPEMRRMADDEIKRLTPEIEKAREALIRSIVPPNPDDSRNAMVEIRAGTGGEEASLFASELLRAYTRFAEKKGWKHELLSLSHSDLGGVREAVLLIEGEGASALLRHEAGVHRVQGVLRCQGLGQLRGLPLAFGVEGNVELALDAGVDIPSSFAMTDGQYSGGLRFNVKRDT